MHSSLGQLVSMLLPWQKWRMRPRPRCLAAVAGLCLLAAVTGAAVAEPAASAATVTVQRGQTLTQLAAQLHTSVAALVATNHLANPNRVLAGQVLTVPGTSTVVSTVTSASVGTSASATLGTVVVSLGQTLSSIASRYHVTVAALLAANHLANPNRVLAGSRLVIPASPSAASSPGMQLLSYSVPASTGAATGGLPAGLLAHPDRLALQPAFAAAASRYGVPVALLEAMCWWESGWQASVVSKTGAVGVCQIEPATATFVNQYLVSPPLNAKVATQNIALGAAYLGDLLRASGGNVGLALAGYYQGLAAVRVFGMLPATATYVQGIEAYTTIFAR